MTAAVDLLAAHPYSRYVETPDRTGVVDRVRAMRRAMETGGASAKSLWLTEVGWATGRDDGRFTLS